MKRSITILILIAALFAFVAPSAHAACTQAISTAAKGGWLTGLFLKADTYKIAFYTSTAAFDGATSQYTATNEVSGTNYSAGGFTLDSLTIGTSGTTYWMDWADEVNNTITFTNASTCAMIYDATDKHTSCSASGTPYPCCTGSQAGCAGDMTLAIFTFTSVQPSAGTLTVTFPTADASNAVIRIAKSLWEVISPFGEAIASERRDAIVKLTGVTTTAETLAPLPGLVNFENN